MRFSSWTFYQIFPSMYSTEILIKRKNNQLISKVHHPMRIFFEKNITDKCNDTTIISIKYRNIEKTKTVRFCNNRLITEVMEGQIKIE